MGISYKWYGFGLKGQRSRLGSTAIRRAFELYECLLVTIIIFICTQFSSITNSNQVAHITINKQISNPRQRTTVTVQCCNIGRNQQQRTDTASLHRHLKTELCCIYVCVCVCVCKKLNNFMQHCLYFTENVTAHF